MLLKYIGVRYLLPISVRSSLSTPSTSDPQRHTAQARRKFAGSGLLQKAVERAGDRPKICFSLKRSSRRYAALRSIRELLGVLALAAR